MKTPFTIYFFSQFQSKNDILKESIFCEPEKCVILASYAVQVKFSDYDEELHQEGYLSNEKLLPESTTSKHNLTSEEWEEKVCLCECMQACMY